MWVVEFELNAAPDSWVRMETYATYEKAAVGMVEETFRDPEYRHRIREVSDVGG